MKNGDCINSVLYRESEFEACFGSNPDDLIKTVGVKVSNEKDQCVSCAIELGGHDVMLTRLVLEVPSKIVKETMGEDKIIRYSLMDLGKI